MTIIQQLYHLSYLFPRSPYLFISREMFEEYEMHFMTLRGYINRYPEVIQPTEVHPTMKLWWTGVHFKAAQLVVVEPV